MWGILTVAIFSFSVLHIISKMDKQLAAQKVKDALLTCVWHSQNLLFFIPAAAQARMRRTSGKQLESLSSYRVS